MISEYVPEFPLIISMWLKLLPKMKDCSSLAASTTDKANSYCFSLLKYKFFTSLITYTE